MKLKKYKTYKLSGIDWIGEIPEDWKEERLKIYFSFKKWKESQLYSWEYVNDPFNEWEYPVYSGQTWNNWVMWSINTYKYNYKDKDVLLVTTVGAKAMTLFKISWKFTLSQNCALIDLKSNKIDTTYYYYYCQRLFEYERELIPDIMQPSLRIEDLREYNIILPPLQSQQKISDFLDAKTQQIEKLIKKDKKLIELMKERRVSMINIAVTKGLDESMKMKDSGIEWETSKFKHLFTFSKWLNITKENLEDEWIPCVNYWEIHSKYGFELNPKIHKLKCVDKSYLRKSRKSLLKRGDFIFSDTSEDLEWSWNFTFLNSDETTFAGYHTVIAKLNSNFNYKFLAYFFDSEYFRAQIRKLVKWVKVYSITNWILKETLISYPWKNEQEEIVKFLDKETSKIDNHIDKVERRIELYEEYKKSLIYNVVTGKIKV